MPFPLAILAHDPGMPLAHGLMRPCPTGLLIADRLLHLLNILGVKNVCCVVSRWYGGIQLGPDRCREPLPRTSHESLPDPCISFSRMHPLLVPALPLPDPQPPQTPHLCAPLALSLALLALS
jgi:hypothetical protein